MKKYVFIWKDMTIATLEMAHLSKETATTIREALAKQYDGITTEFSIYQVLQKEEYTEVYKPI